MKKGKNNSLPQKCHQLIELILSCKDCTYAAEELVRMDEKKLIQVRDGLISKIKEKLNRSGADIIHDTSILGLVNDLFLAKQENSGKINE